MSAPKHTPGDVFLESRGGGVVKGGPVQEFANGSGQTQMFLAVGQGWMGPGEQQANAAELVRRWNAHEELVRERDLLKHHAESASRDIASIGNKLDASDRTIFELMGALSDLAEVAGAGEPVALGRALKKIRLLLITKAKAGAKPPEPVVPSPPDSIPS